MLPVRSLDPFRPLREPDRRRRDEERLSRSEQRTANKPKDHLTGKAPYRFESCSPPAVSQQRTGDGEQAGATSSFVQALGNRTVWRTLPPPPMALVVS